MSELDPAPKPRATAKQRAMHYSYFEYPISRPYPFKWFTPVAITGCVILTVVFSLVNLTSNGFDLKPLYTTDVNGTEAAANAR